MSSQAAFHKDTRGHLFNVYKTLALTVGAATFGAYAYLAYGFFQGYFVSLLTSILSLVLIVSVLSTSRQGPSEARLAMLYLFGFLSGVSSGPLVNMAISIDPALLFTALGGASVIFASFSAASLLAERKSFLFLGAALGSSISLLLFMSLFNIFFRSIAIFNAQLYFGFLVFCAFVIYDTQKIVTKFEELKDHDYVAHALDLFIDFANVFRHLLIILSKNRVESDKDKKKR